MNTLRLFTISLSLAAALSAYSDEFFHVFRNDGGFNTVTLPEGEGVNFSTSGDVPALRLPEKVSVPLDVIDSCAVRKTDIPTFHLYLTDYPNADMLWDKELYLNATLNIDGNGYTESAEGLSLTVKGRGNSTWGMPKKPIRMKFSKKTSICGFDKAKNYVLLNNFVDNTLMRNVVAFWIARRMGVAYANHTMPCNLYINDKYAGSYLMTEKVGINATSVDIDETKGILFELSNEYDEKYKFYSSTYGLPVMVKDPDFDELYEDDPTGLNPAARLQLWQNDFNAAEAKAASGRGAEAFDVESFVNWMLLQEIVGNNELGHPKSVYINKESLDAGALYRFGPAWDFDVCFNFATPNGNSYSEVSASNGMWLNRLCEVLLGTPEVQTRYRERVAEFVSDVYPELKKFLAEYALLIEPSAKLNALRWPDEMPWQGWAHIIPTYDTKKNVERLTRWIDNRVGYLSAKYL